jgi:hypothetical protein
MARMKTNKDTRVFATGSIRDSAEGKPRLSLLPYDLLIHVANWLEKGGKHYGDHNWRLGQPKQEVFDSLQRHCEKYWEGLKDEDHLSAIIVNAFFLMHVDLYMSDNPELNNLNPMGWKDKIEHSYRAKKFGEEDYVYGNEYIAYIDKGGHNHCFIYNLTVDENIPIDEWSLEEWNGDEWVKMKRLNVEIW